MHLDATKFSPTEQGTQGSKNRGSSEIRVADVRCHGVPKVGIISASISNSSFSLHTYLVRREAITKAFSYDLSPALHIAEAKVIELPSGTSFAQFLMVFLTSEAFSSFHQSCRFTRWLGEEIYFSQIGRLTRYSDTHTEIIM